MRTTGNVPGRLQAARESGQRHRGDHHDATCHGRSRHDHEHADQRDDGHRDDKWRLDEWRVGRERDGRVDRQRIGEHWERSEQRVGGDRKRYRDDDLAHGDEELEHDQRLGLVEHRLDHRRRGRGARGRGCGLLLLPPSIAGGLSALDPLVH
jgi:hypothetical protein